MLEDPVTVHHCRKYNYIKETVTITFLKPMATDNISPKKTAVLHYGTAAATVSSTSSIVNEVLLPFLRQFSQIPARFPGVDWKARQEAHR